MIDYNNRLVFLLDWGHGGMIGDEYLTAPAKMKIFPDGTTIYEGERNRILGEFVSELAYQEGLLTYEVCGNSQLDVPLAVRTNVANDLNDRYPHCVYCSFHNNAGGGHGTEIFTSPGQTGSDEHASLLLDILDSNLEDMVIRSDFHSDGDVDKEKRLWVLVKTNCPAFLLELAFFDDVEDAKKLMNDDYLFEVAKSIVQYMKKAEEIELW